jgi:hypothetical protein
MAYIYKYKKRSPLPKPTSKKTGARMFSQAAKIASELVGMKLPSPLERGWGEANYFVLLPL